jgi:hypothetical protein
MQTITLLLLLLLQFSTITTTTTNSVLLVEQEQQQNDNNNNNNRILLQKNNNENSVVTNTLRTSVQHAITDTNKVGSYCPTTYKCLCYEQGGYAQKKGWSVYNSGWLSNCVERNVCTGLYDPDCCQCRFVYYPPSIPGGTYGYEQLSCCTGPPPPPTPAPTYNCDCSCNSAHGSCLIVPGGNGACTSMDACCHCAPNITPSTGSYSILGCCTKSPTKQPSTKPSQDPTRQPTPPTPPTLTPTTHNPTPPTTHRPISTYSPTPGSTVPCNCKCYGYNWFDEIPLDSIYHMCCNMDYAISYQCQQCCLSESPTRKPTTIVAGG